MRFPYKKMVTPVGLLFIVGCNTLGDCEVSPPTIVSQPQSQTVVEGGDITFSVQAANAPIYRWQKDGVDVPEYGTQGIERGANDKYEIKNVSLSRAGTYTVIITNAKGGECAYNPKSITSAPAVLIVTPRATQSNETTIPNDSKSSVNP